VRVVTLLAEAAFALGGDRGLVAALTVRDLADLAAIQDLDDSRG